MTRKITPEERARLAYQGDLRRKNSLEQKLLNQKQVVRRGEKLVSRRKNNEVVVSLKKLTPAEINKERAILEKLKTELKDAKDSLKYSRFGYKTHTKKTANRFKQKRSSMNEKNRQKSMNKMSRLFESGQKNGKLEELRAITANLKKKDYGDTELKKDILPILNSYNNSIPITSLSKDAVKKIKEMLNDIK